MAKYVGLCQFTDQGVRAVKESAKRADANRALAKQCGVTIKEILWTLGAVDLVMVFEAPNDEAATAYMLSIAAKGNVTTQTMRAFDAEEFGAVTAKMA